VADERLRLLVERAVAVEIAQVQLERERSTS